MVIDGTAPDSRLAVTGSSHMDLAGHVVEEGLTTTDTSLAVTGP